MKFRNQFLRFYRPDDGVDVSGSDSSDDSQDTSDDDTSDEQSGDNDEQEQEAPTPAVTRIEVDYEALGRSIGESIRGNTPAPQETPEQLRARLNVYDASEDDINELMEGGPKAVAAMNRMLQGKSREIATVVKLTLDHKFAEVAHRYDPLLTDVQARQAEQFKNELTSEHPDLAPLKAQLPGLANALFSNGFKAVPNNPVETRKNIASAIRAMNIIPPGSPTKAAPKHTSIPSGNGGGAVTKTKTKKTESGDDFLSVWDKINS